MENPAYIFSRPEKIKKILKNKLIYLFLDYDGTLAPIAQTPGKAVMPKETADLLRRLSKMPDCKIAIVSGRRLKDAAKQVGLKNIVYVGNHGFEIKSSNKDFKSPLPPQYKKTLNDIMGKLKEKLSPVKGVFIEDKGFSISVHYRLADAKAIPLIKAGLYSITVPYITHKDVIIRTGKMVFDIVPPAVWNKGKAVLWLLVQHKFMLRNKKIPMLPIYVGDDATDEDAFLALKGRGMTVFVGKPKKTEAQLYLKNESEVVVFLKLILEILSGGYHGKNDSKNRAF